MRQLSITALTFIVVVLLAPGCHREEPEFGQRQGDSLFFSGRYWTIKKYETTTWGPGPNYFSAHPNDVWVDSKDRLHMTISNRDEKWFATEVISADTMGYGTYTFTVVGDLTNIPENITLGLFTWDNNSFQEAGNSEVDIEFSKWGDTATNQTLNYAVQPVAFGPTFKERVTRAQLEDVEDIIGISTHEFTWTPRLISWKSYKGEEKKEDNQIAEWSFDLDNPARVKNEGGKSSDPIIIPKPGKTTNTRINFWIQTWLGAAPADGLRHEVIIKEFEYQGL